MDYAKILLDELDTQDKRQAFVDKHGKDAFQALAKEAGESGLEEENRQADTTEKWNTLRQVAKERNRSRDSDEARRRRAALIPKP